MATRSRTKRLLKAVAGLVVLGMLILPAAGAQNQHTLRAGIQAQLSQGPLVRYYIAHPDQAPAAQQDTFTALAEARARAGASARAQGTSAAAAPMASARFNRDELGLPQNEDSVTRCAHNHKVVVEGTNDYRGIVDPAENFTGWDFSNDGGKSVTNEGLLPPIDFGGGTLVPSGGDPVNMSDGKCKLYAVDLNYDPNTLFPNGIGLYKSNPQTLASCPGGTDSSCWPKRKLVAAATGPEHFLDKPWAYVGISGDAGKVVWITYTDFTTTGPGPTDFTASIYAVRCAGDISGCTDPIKISGNEQDVQFSDVTIGPDGRTYISWSQINGEIEGTPQSFDQKLRVAQPGSTTFGRIRSVSHENEPIPFGGVLHANDFRVATYPKSEVKIVNGQPRVYVVWEGCRARPLDSICEEPQVKLRYSDSFGRGWSNTKILSASGDNYFTTISRNPGARGLAVAWFTNRHDGVFHNRQDIELVKINPDGQVRSRARLTHPSNESESDPLLGGVFIGDYIEVTARNNVAAVAYNANYRSEPLGLDDGLPVPQQDNYLSKAGL